MFSRIIVSVVAVSLAAASPARAGGGSSTQDSALLGYIRHCMSEKQRSALGERARRNGVAPQTQLLRECPDCRCDLGGANSDEPNVPVDFDRLPPDRG